VCWRGDDVATWLDHEPTPVESVTVDGKEYPAQLLGADPPGPTRQMVSVPIRINRFKVTRV